MSLHLTASTHQGLNHWRGLFPATIRAFPQAILGCRFSRTLSICGCVYCRDSVCSFLDSVGGAQAAADKDEHPDEAEDPCDKDQVEVI